MSSRADRPLRAPPARAGHLPRAFLAGRGFSAAPGETRAHELQPRPARNVGAYTFEVVRGGGA